MPTQDNEPFSRFWEAYPRKTAKGSALKAWQKLNPDLVLIETIIASVHDHKRTKKWLEKDGEYVPYPATFLNQQRFLDEIKSPATVNSPINGQSFKPLYQKKEGVRPQEHICHANVKKMRAAYDKAKADRTGQKGMSWVRGLLAVANWYEALHVQCTGELCPTCPICGEVQNPYINPFIEKLMEQYPGETVGWSPYQKGFLPCPTCEVK